MIKPLIQHCDVCLEFYLNIITFRYVYMYQMMTQVESKRSQEGKYIFIFLTNSGNCSIIIAKSPNANIDNSTKDKVDNQLSQIKKRSYEEALLHTFQESNSTDNIRKPTLLFAEHYNIIIVALTDSGGMEHNVVLSLKFVQQLENSLNSPKPLQLSLPGHNHHRFTNHIIRDIDIRSLAESGIMSRFLAKRKYSQLNNDITTILNKDQTISSRQKYAVTKGFCAQSLLILKMHVDCLSIQLRYMAETLLLKRIMNSKIQLYPAKIKH